MKLANKFVLNSSLGRAKRGPFWTHLKKARFFLDTEIKHFTIYIDTKPNLQSVKRTHNVHLNKIYDVSCILVLSLPFENEMT